jgi:peptidoglycan hydrolase-like protein with peptidoglycan-binding domain
VLTWHAPPAILAPGWDGVVQSVSIEAGQALGSGDVVARIAGIDRLACASDYPMAGPVALNDKGQDVQTLQQCLTVAGFDVARDKGTYGLATKAAVASWSKQTGAPSDAGAIFDSAWLVFLPEEDYQVLNVDLAVAAPAPTGGTAIATARPALTRAVLTTLDGSDDVGQLGPDGEPMNVRVEVAPEDLIAADDDEALMVGTAVIALTPERNEVAAEDLEILGSKVQANAAIVAARLQRQGGAGELLVPAAAVVATQEGITCVLRIAGVSLEPVAVEVTGDIAGSSIVKGELKPGDQVRVAPAAKDRRCAST